MEDTKTLSEQLAEQTFIDPGMISAALEYWLTDTDHIRSPFPKELHKKIAEDAAGAMLLWASKLSDAAKKEFNDDLLSERFEEILFEVALQMVTDEDQKITIRYPFMPRIGDPIAKTSADAAEKTGTIVKRRIDKRGDAVFLVVDYSDPDTGNVVSDEFELPE